MENIICNVRTNVTMSILKLSVEMKFANEMEYLLLSTQPLINYLTPFINSCFALNLLKGNADLGSQMLESKATRGFVSIHNVQCTNRQLTAT